MTIKKFNDFMQQAELKNRRVIELNRFVHYYTRFKNHENSYKVCGGNQFAAPLTETVAG
jgi:hypothetical protein